MLSAHLIELVELHAERLTKDLARELLTNPRTPGFRKVRYEDLERRLFQILHDLGTWISDPKADRVQAEFSEWGRRRFDQGIPLTEIVYAVLLLKKTLRRYIRDNGLNEEAVPRIFGDDVLPLHLHGLLELNSQVSEFFDEAIYHLAYGYEEEARRLGQRIGKVS
jgi:hypothetical protein